MAADPSELIRHAVRLSAEQMRQGVGGPFGAIIVRDGTVIAEGWNRVTSDNDPTAHAEVTAIRRACAALGTFSLQGCEIYTSCEPCPMCLAAIHWAKIDRVVFGATIGDAAEAGFCELHVAAESLTEMGGSPLVVEGGLLREECAALFSEWKKAGLCGTY